MAAVVNEPVVAVTPEEVETTAPDAETEDGKVLNRAEKKSRKALQKLGLTPIPGVNRVAFRKTKGNLFVISNPDVFKSPDSETYVIFGEAVIEDTSAAQAAQAQAAQAFAAGASLPEMDTAVPEVVDAPAAIVDEADESGLSADDIEMVMQQADVSRAAAAKALRDNDSDIVNAIMSLTS